MMKRRDTIRFFLKNDAAVLGLPMRLTVSLILGTVVLLAILTTLVNPLVFSHKLLVSISPLVATVEDSTPENVSFLVMVTDTDGAPVCDASIIIKGLGGAGAGISDTDGNALVQLQVAVEEGLYEGYLDVSVKAAGYVSFEHQDMLKVVKRNRY
ncbi:MAG: hypothetical protein WC525_02160 [Candidatus Thermoplasmatota archaeon]